MFSEFLLAVLFCGQILAQRDPCFESNRTTIVHLFEWKWSDIANECEGFLKDKGYGGIQISPPNENLVIHNNGERPWWERYQPVSYQLVTRSGDRNAFADMVRRCRNAGINIYADVVFNHMTGMDGTGTAGSSASKSNYEYPGVSYGRGNFHQPPCDVNNYQDRYNIQNCELSGLADLDQSQDYVRGKIRDYLNDLLSLGVAGFRVDAAKHMAATDLRAILDSTNNLNTNFGFKANTRPFVYQEVIDLGGEAVSRDEYTDFGTVCEFRNGVNLGEVFQGKNGQKLSMLSNWGSQWGLVDGLNAVVFIDNHDTQRGDDDRILNYKKSKQYKMAIAFMQAHPYGTTKILSGFNFDYHDQGPPTSDGENLLGPGFNADDTCTNGWTCEHRWRQIYNMVGFRDVVTGTTIENWWDNGDQQIAFSRGNKGFVAFSNYGDINTDIKTGLPAGTYCDLISGALNNGKCTGKSLTVANGAVHVSLGANEDDGVVAIHVNAKL